MIQKIYSLKDTISGNFGGLFLFNIDGVAIREMTTIVNSEQVDKVIPHYEDMDLYSVGSFDVDTGVITSEVKFVIHLKDLKGE